MALYLKAPRGFVDYQILQKCVEQRLDFFKHMTASCVSVHSIEFLFEDSAFDRAGHFTLRLAAVKNSSFSSYFIHSELKLLHLRLDSYDAKTTQTFLKSQLRHARECQAEGAHEENVLAVLNCFIDVFVKMLGKSYRSHVFDQTHSRSTKCRAFTLNVPFQHCMSLISSHEVDIKNGYVQIPCEKWKQLLVSLFYTYLRIAVNEMHHSANVQIALEDERIKSILALICIQEDIPVNNSKIALAHIEAESKFFPLCMQNLQNVLKKKHRLAHEERFNLSLFLKDIGVSVDDSLAYWKSEYSKEHADCSKCSHNWQKDEKRYIYSIRHMYGLEGSRRTYNTRTCNYFQNVMLSPTQEGGCPFKQFDGDNLKRLISSSLESDDKTNSILLERTRSSSKACKLFLKTVASINNIQSPLTVESGCSSDCDINFNNPVQYFLVMKKM